MERVQQNEIQWRQVYGPQNWTYKIIENTMLFTPNFEDLIRIVEIAKDLEIMIDKNNT